MSGTIQCATHGETRQSFVCSHLSGDSVGAGFNRKTPTTENPFPDAWCDDCEIIRAAGGGWNEASEKLSKMVILCSGCYERARIRNTRTSTSLGDLVRLRWKCATCEEWHTGPCLDFSYDSPYFWGKELEDEPSGTDHASEPASNLPGTFLDDDLCAINGNYFFVRGTILLPIIGTRENLCWGVWGSLSRANFAILWEKRDEPGYGSLPSMFSWLSCQIHDYPDTLNLKMQAHFKGFGRRPEFELEPTDHSLSLEFHNGVTPTRVKDIMMRQLRDAEYK
jgi:hypothetical protein